MSLYESVPEHFQCSLDKSYLIYSMQAVSDAPRSNTRHVPISDFTIARFAADIAGPANPASPAQAHVQPGPISQQVNHQAELFLAMLQLEHPQGALAAMPIAEDLADLRADQSHPAEHPAAPHPCHPPPLPCSLPCHDDIGREDYDDAVLAAFTTRCPFMVCCNI